MKLLLCILLIYASKRCYSQEESEVCPKPGDISPCTCDLEGISCYHAKSEADVERAFKAANKVKAIREFWVHGTPLKLLTKNMFNGYLIRKMHLDHNKIELIEDGAFDCIAPFVVSLGMAHNALRWFPFTVKFPLLDTLVLANNRIEKIPPNAFDGFEKLSKLDLSSNLISTIGRNAFRQVQFLTSLALTNNQITSLDAYSLALHPNAAPELYLSMNTITTIHKLAFEEAHPMSIKLPLNNLTYLNEGVFRPLMIRMLDKHEGSAYANVAGNPFTCKDCESNKWLVTNKSLTAKFFDDFTCTNGVSLEKLTVDDISC